MLVAGIVLAIFFIVTVVVPAVSRGGFGEFAIVAAIFATILIVERWVRGG